MEKATLNFYDVYTTFGVDPARTGVPLGMINYHEAIARYIKEKISEGTQTQEGQPEICGRLQSFGNDLSRAAVALALRFGLDDLVKNLEIALTGQGEHPSKDDISREVQKLEQRTQIGRAVILAAREIIPGLNTVLLDKEKTHDAVGSLISEARRDKSLRSFILSGLENILSQKNILIGALEKNHSVEDLLLACLTSNFSGQSEEVTLMPYAMYAPVQAFTGAALLSRDNGSHYVTYKGNPKMRRSEGAAVWGGRTLSELTRTIAIECTGNNQLLNNPNVMDAIRVRFFVLEQADGSKFTNDRCSISDPFYLGDSTGAGTDEQSSGKGDKKIPLVELVERDDGGKSFRSLLDPLWWMQNMGTSLDVIDGSGPKAAAAEQIDPLFRAVLAPEHISRQVRILIRTLGDDEVQRRLLGPTTNGKKSLILDRELAKFAIGLAEEIRELAESIYSKLMQELQHTTP